MKISRRGFLAGGAATAALPTIPVITLVKPAAVGMTEISHSALFQVGMRMAISGIDQIFNPQED